MIFVRSAITFAAAGCVTLALFSSMRLMVGMTESKLRKVPPRGSITMTPTMRDSAVRTKRTTPPQRKMLPQAPPTPVIDTVEMEGPGTIGVIATAAPPPVVDTSFTQGFSLTAGPTDAGLVPRVRIEPIYPTRAVQSRIEGWVELAFDVTATGATTRIRVVKAQPKKIFNRAAIKAISRWKYQPQVVDGKPVVTRNQRVLLQFNLRNRTQI